MNAKHRHYPGTDDLRPIFDVVATEVEQFGNARIEPDDQAVTLLRGTQFAVLRPASGLVELRLALGDVPGRGRLVADGQTHVMTIRSASEVDEEVIGWLREAYDRAG